MKAAAHWRRSMPQLLVEEELVPNRWWAKLLAFVAKLFNALIMHLHYVLAALLVLLLYYWLFGNDKAAVVETARHMHPPTSPLAYKWLANNRDTSVSQHVIDARAGKSMGLIVLVPRHRQDAVVSGDVKCSTMFSTNESVQNFYTELMIDAEEFLRGANHTACVCAPQLGRHVKYMAFRADAHTTAPSANEVLGESSDDNNNRILHLFNPIDSSADAYETLNDADLVALGVGLKVTIESQDYRYNEARGTYSVLRRTKLSIVGVDKACHRERIGLMNQLAVSAEECLDLLRGVDVRERAARQEKLGVILNKPPAPPPTVVKTATEKIKTEL
jgi:hypothetical protein